MRNKHFSPGENGFVSFSSSKCTRTALNKWSARFGSRNRFNSPLDLYAWVVYSGPTRHQLPDGFIPLEI